MLRCMVRFDGTRPEFSPYGFTCEVWTPARMPRPDRHSEIEINLLKAGSLTYLFGGHRTTVKAGRLAVFWAAIPHQIVGFNGEEPYFVVTWPLGELLASKLELNVVNRTACRCSSGSRHRRIRAPRRCDGRSIQSLPADSRWSCIGPDAHEVGSAAGDIERVLTRCWAFLPGASRSLPSRSSSRTESPCTNRC